ncbi:LOW QUALITY PROTEIN: protein Notchless-like [Ctenocephalides felis]|uniref:LOW QUALITY PROTEIN: protein Notchless-like n=1 Tax=Ctenocephalides felis TaxID=7515 RepID=UPI000E6E4325|nr:LOW QUALITY PROTEIN: protein Notchless-like [Ctenocephalides felis]
MEISPPEPPTTITARFKSDSGEDIGTPFNLPFDVTVEQLGLVCNALLQNEKPVPYLFFVNEVEINKKLSNSIDLNTFDTEGVLDIVYQEQAVFKVRPVSRCTSSLPGHAEAVISLSFGPQGDKLASGSGDTTVRLWDILTQTPIHVCKGHRQWVLCVSWSPCGTKLASGCKAGEIKLWNPETGQQIGKTLIGHKQYITSLSWEPYHSNPDCRLLASSSKDTDVKIWDTVLCQHILTLSGHTQAVTTVKWGGLGLLYTGSHDREIKIWRAKDGILCRTLKGHAHWVNSLALNTDYVLRTGPFHPVMDKNVKITDKNVMKQLAQERYNAVCSDYETLVSCSDDFTLYLWTTNKNKCIARLTGHQNVVNDVKFSPDVRLIASASFDKSVRLWSAVDGKFIATLRGHVQAVYSIAWAADSRLLVSGSADSTLKVWSIANKKLEMDLPGHADDIYAVDWSTDGLKVASGGKDKVLRLWQH